MSGTHLLQQAPQINFRFNPEKFVQAVALLATSVCALTQPKAVKLLALADREHLRRYGRPILCDGFEAVSTAPEVADGERDLFRSTLNFKKSFWHRCRIFTPKVSFDRNAFSDSELGVLREIAQTYGKLTEQQLMNITRRSATC
jgi:uncharacterized phage-associated protein